MNSVWLPAPEARKIIDPEGKHHQTHIYRCGLPTKKIGGKVHFKVEMNGTAAPISTRVGRGTTLLEKARAATPGKTFSPPSLATEELELAMAVAKGEVTARQVMVALGKKGINATNWADRMLRQAVRDGRLVVRGS